MQRTSPPRLSHEPPSPKQVGARARASLIGMDRLAVCSYADFEPSMGVPVRTSVGYPRFIWKGPKLEYARICAPHGIFGTTTDPHAYLTAYRDHLDAHAGEVSSQLHRIAQAHPGARLVLLCFERLDQPGKWCHRTTLAAWLEERTGTEVPELGPVGNPFL